MFCQARAISREITGDGQNQLKPAKSTGLNTAVVATWYICSEYDGFDLLAQCLGQPVLKKVAPHLLYELAPQALSVLQGELVGNMFISLNQMFAAETISDLGLASTELLEKLTELLDHPWWQVRLKAIQALGGLRRNIPGAAIQHLLAFRRDPDPRMRAVREAADDALAEILSLEAGIEDDDE